MLELIKKQIHMSRIKAKAVTEITLDEDYIIPDVKPDVVQILLKKSEAVVSELRQLPEKLHIKGELEFEILYAGETAERFGNVTAVLGFEDTAAYPGLEARDYVRCRARAEDISIRIVNSRKLHINAVIGIELVAYSPVEQETAQGVSHDMEVDLLEKDEEIITLQIQKKDTFRIQEDIAVLQGKPQLSQLLWRDFDIRSIEYHMEDGRVLIDAQAQVFVIYKAAEKLPLQWMEKSLDFHGEMQVDGCSQDMIYSISHSIINSDISIREDEDGENRILHIDAAVELDLKLYQEQSVHVLCDAYSMKCRFENAYKKIPFEKLLIKNQAECRISDKITLESRDSMLALCSSQGHISIDRTEITEDGIKAEGAVYVTIIYLAADDDKPVQSASAIIPFSHVIEAEKITEECSYDIIPTLMQLTAAVAAGGEIQVRAVISFDTIVMSEITLQVLDEIKQEEKAEEKSGEMCMVTGYIVQPDDTLWSIAKKYRMSRESIRKLNQLKDDEVKESQKLIIIREE